jgi:hypothetical protein
VKILVRTFRLEERSEREGALARKGLTDQYALSNAANEESNQHWRKPWRRGDDGKEYTIKNAKEKEIRASSQ